MKFFLKRTSIILIILLTSVLSSQAQSIRVLGGDVFNGAVTGVGLGAATIALQNSSDTNPLRVGAGIGLLYGIGTGIYDVTSVPKDYKFYKSGTFNDGNNSTILVLLDTAYGAAGGAVLGSAIALIGNNSFLNGLQYGSGAGAWIGFGFGLIDSFVLAEGPGKYRAAAVESAPKAAGIVQVIPTSSAHLSLGFIHPTVIAQKKVSPTNITTNYSMGVQFVNMNISF